ncbi:acyl-coenzyme A diphosphatase NUDT19 isoform X3 [Cygnus atratus]|uniref:acyl-coenzyme A diphosphatase NUDT19 isoform X3 n=1 Tax=Cygnus atratus TaxID=8868 RepID=UPI0021B775FE|nr:acyl-coenzyme A diphosphatase NUDT19 isoform X3 [Cygnus atratus]
MKWKSEITVNCKVPQPLLSQINCQRPPSAAHLKPFDITLSLCPVARPRGLRPGAGRCCCRPPCPQPVPVPSPRFAAAPPGAQAAPQRPSRRLRLPLSAGPAMNPRLRHWREAATLLLPAGTAARPGRSALGPCDYEVLLLQRSSRSGFAPGAHVFPGGVVEAADFSAAWLGLLPASPLCGLGSVKPPPAGSGRAPIFATDRLQLGSPLPGEVAFRICAIRETFEEAGILLLVPGSGPGEGGEARPLPAESLLPAAELGEWRRRVREDAGCFLQLCRHLGCVPNIWALHEWSNWLTPVGRAGPGGRRYDTAFYLCCLDERPPHASEDEREVTACLWSSPPEAIELFKSREILLAPPQFYELCRLCNFSSLHELHKFSSDRALEGCECWMPIMLTASDGLIQLLPGDELYPEDPDYTGETKIVMSTDKKVEDLMKEVDRNLKRRNELFSSKKMPPTEENKILPWKRLIPQFSIPHFAS